MTSIAATKSLACASCNWRFLPGQEQLPPVCPNCRSDQVSEFLENKSYAFERALPFSVSASEFHTRVEEFSKRIPFAPKDLTPSNLTSRFEKIFLPRYLVDAGVKAIWQAEVGFNYQVVSHQEIYHEVGWKTVEQKETRKTWEPRMGRLERTYQNVYTPALEDDAKLIEQVGGFSLSGSEVVPNGNLEQWVRVPDRDPRDAWSEAVGEFQKLAAEECRLAAGGDHIESFNWEPEFNLENWTLLLIPVYSSYYVDDENNRQRVMVNGQTGAVYGELRASETRAKQLAVILLTAAVLLFGGSVVIGLLSPFLPVLALLAILLFLASAACGIGAAFPVFIARRFNSKQVET